MCRSKKDGRKGGAHRMGTRSKWHEAKLRRRARIERRNGLSFAVWEHEQEMAALETEIREEFLAQYELEVNSWEWTQDYLSWQDNLLPSYEDQLHFEYDWDRYEDDFHFWDDPPREQEPQTHIFEAVDRAVRRYGVEAVRYQAHMLAATLDCTSWEIERAVKLTREGYIMGGR